MAQVRIKKFFLPGSRFFMCLSCFALSFGTPAGEKKWVEAQFKRLSLVKQLGQLFMVAVYPEQGVAEAAYINHLIQAYGIGGLIFMEGVPTKHVAHVHRFQTLSSIPLWMGLDAEWGVGMRLQHSMAFPKQMTLGAITDHKLIYAMGIEVARQLRILGIHINFAPVLDVLTNPFNDSIGVRSFGSSPMLVAEKGMAYIQGLQSQGLLAVAKHFPGQGDADQDSHYALPCVRHPKTRLEAVELYPFKKAIAAGVGGVMVAHMALPAYDSIAATLSPAIATQLLKQKLGFEGLVFTDALNMKAVAQNHPPGKLELLALQAGNDVLLFPQEVPKAIAYLKKAVEKNILSRKVIAQKVKKILTAKYRLGLATYKPPTHRHIYQQLNTEAAKKLKETLFAQAITLVSNQDNLVPMHPHQYTMASLTIKTTQNKTTCAGTLVAPTTAFTKKLEEYVKMDHYLVHPNSLTAPEITYLSNKLSLYQVVIVALYPTKYAKKSNFGIHPEIVPWLQQLINNGTKVLSVVFGHVYSLKALATLPNLIMAYQEDPVVQKLVPAIIFKDLPTLGHLPVDISAAWPLGWGIHTTGIGPDLVKKLRTTD